MSAVSDFEQSGSEQPMPESAPVETITETPMGTWRRVVGPDGAVFREYRSRHTLCGLPIVHVTIGKSPETNKRVMARGVIAIGRKACGVVAIGQFAWGLIAVGQLALGIIFGLGQAATGVACIGQAAISIVFALGQFALGDVAIGQIAYGTYVLAQIGFGTHVWDMRGVDPIARQFFGQWL